MAKPPLDRAVTSAIILRICAFLACMAMAAAA